MCIRDSLHVIRRLEDWAIHDVGATRGELGMERMDVAHPEEDVPGPALPLVRTDPIRIGDETQHDGEAVARDDRELGRRSSDVLRLESKHALIVLDGASDVADGEVWGAA